MDKSNVDTDRLIRFSVLYEVAFGELLNLDEFMSNEVYALRVIHRAGNNRSPELRNLAAHLEIERQAHVEPVTVKDMDPLGKTWKMGVLPAGADNHANPSRRARRAA